MSSNWCPSAKKEKETDLITKHQHSSRIMIISGNTKTYFGIVGIQLCIELFCSELGSVPPAPPTTAPEARTSTWSSFTPLKPGLSKSATVKASATIMGNSASMFQQLAVFTSITLYLIRHTLVFVIYSV